MTSIPSSDKTITVDVPEERVPEFYAFYARFLAGAGRGRRRGGPGHRGHHGHHGPCGHHEAHAHATDAEHDAPEGAEV